MADLHCGAVTGLLPPKHQRDEVRLIAGPLWDWYSGTVDAIGPVDVLVVDGDIVDGPGLKDSGNGHVTTDTEEQAEIAVEAIGVIKAKSTYLCYGTPYHTVGTHSWENMVARELDAPIRDTQFLNINGCRLSVRHVVGRSDTPYGQGTLTHKEVVRDLLEALQDDAEPADVVVRAHIHTYYAIDDGDRWGIVCPCLQIPGSVFGRTQRPWRYRVGMLVLDIDADGKVHVDKRIMPLRVVRRREYVKV